MAVNFLSWRSGVVRGGLWIAGWGRWWRPSRSWRRRRRKPQAEDPLHAWNAGSDPASLDAWVHQRLAAAQANIDKVIGGDGRAYGGEHAAAL